MKEAKPHRPNNNHEFFSYRAVSGARTSTGVGMSTLSQTPIAQGLGARLPRRPRPMAALVESALSNWRPFRPLLGRLPTRIVGSHRRIKLSRLQRPHHKHTRFSRRVSFRTGRPQSFLVNFRFRYSNRAPVQTQTTITTLHYYNNKKEKKEDVPWRPCAAAWNWRGRAEHLLITHFRKREKEEEATTTKTVVIAEYVDTPAELSITFFCVSVCPIPSLHPSAS